MKEIYRVEDQLLGGYMNGDLPFFSTTEGSAIDAAVSRQLEEARSLARGGDLPGARELCAEIVLQHQLRLHDNRNLLRVAVGALVHARGFQLLNRLLRAVDGRQVRVSITPTAAGAAPPSHLVRHSLLDGVEVFTLEEGLFADPSCDAIIDRWSRRLVDADRSAPESVAA